MNRIMTIFPGRQHAAGMNPRRAEFVLWLSLLSHVVSRHRSFFSLNHSVHTNCFESPPVSRPLATCGPSVTGVVPARTADAAEWPVDSIPFDAPPNCCRASSPDSSTANPWASHRRSRLVAPDTAGLATAVPGPIATWARPFPDHAPPRNRSYASQFR